jgi:hypothetical protein
MVKKFSRVPEGEISGCDDQVTPDDRFGTLLEEGEEHLEKES